MNTITEIIRKSINDSKKVPNSSIAIEIMIADLYKKIIFFKGEELDSFEEYLVDSLLNGEGYAIVEMAQTNEEILKMLVKDCKWFYNLSILEKQQIMAKVQEDDSFLEVSKNNPLLLMDAIAYTPSFDKNSILDYYKNYIDVYGKSTSSHNKAVNTIVEYLEEMENNDPKKYSKIIISIIKSYYQMKKFMSDCFDDMLSEDDKIYLHIIENKSLDEIIELTKFNQVFMSDLVGEYLYMYSEPNYFEEEMKEFITTKIPDDIRIRLKLD